MSSKVSAACRHDQNQSGSQIPVSTALRQALLLLSVHDQVACKDSPDVLAGSVLQLSDDLYGTSRL